MDAAVGTGVAPGRFEEAETARRSARREPPPSRFWSGKTTTAVSPWPTEVPRPASTPRSLTSLDTAFAMPAAGESKQTVPPTRSQTTGSLGLAAPAPVARKPTTARQRNGPANGAPSAPAGRTNSGSRRVVRSVAAAGSNGRSVEM